MDDVLCTCAEENLDTVVFGIPSNT